MDQFDCEMMGMHITNLNVLRRSLTYGLLTLSFSEECAEMISVVWDGSCLEGGKVGWRSAVGRPGPGGEPGA